MSSAEHRFLNVGLNVFGILVCLTILAIGDAHLIGPVNELQLAVTAKITAIQDLAARAATLVGRHSEAQQRLAARESSKADNLARVPEALEAPKFLGQVAELARTNGVEVVQSRFGDPVVVGQHTAVDVYLEVVGSFASLCGLLEDVEAMPRLCEVRRLHVQPAEPGAERLTVELTLRIFAAPVEVAQAGSAPYE
jgi:Tfp pilus assembly protein PilO